MTEKELLRAVLHEAWLLVHVIRFAHDHGKAGGPDNFYNGVLHAQRQIEWLARRHGIDRVYDHVEHLPRHRADGPPVEFYPRDFRWFPPQHKAACRWVEQGFSSCLSGSREEHYWCAVCRTIKAKTP